jgi:hypothetical protein
MGEGKAKSITQMGTLCVSLNLWTVEMLGSTVHPTRRQGHPGTSD